MFIKTQTLLLFFLFLVCSSLPAAAISTQEEIQLGSQAAGQFERKYGVVSDPAMVGRLDRIARSLLSNVERKDLPWRFRVINVDAFNAAAFPGGFIYTTKGLMNGLSDEELAFVVGHEIGHVEKRHSIKQLKSAQLRQLGLIAIIAGASGGKINKNTATLLQLTEGIISSKFSRGDEAESDRYGMWLMAAAGYDPAYALASLQKLASSGGGGTPDFLNTLLGSHPLPQDRINDGAELVTKIPFTMSAIPAVNPVAGGDMMYPEASAAMEYTLSLLGNHHRDTLQRLAEEVALGKSSAPVNLRVLRVKGDKNAGVSGLENELLTSPYLATVGQFFGVAVVDRGGGAVEAIVILQGGR